MARHCVAEEATILIFFRGAGVFLKSKILGRVLVN